MTAPVTTDAPNALCEVPPSLQVLRPYLIGPSADGLPPAQVCADPEVVGSKAALLAKIAAMQLPTPPAFVLPTALCGPLNRGEAGAREALEAAIDQGLAFLQSTTGLRFGDPRAPLLVSVRSGAPHSMPGMLSTVLNVGLNGQTVHGLIRRSGNPRLAWDCYQRFVAGYAEVVDGAAAAPFEAALARAVQAEGAADAAELDPEALERLARAMSEAAAAISRPIPYDPRKQLLAAARAVYASWEAPRARTYRQLNGLSDQAGTAVTVQAMVFGNAGGDSGAGVAFTRDPATGAPGLVIDYLADAQGEDVVSGRRTPRDGRELGRRLPAALEALAAGARQLEQGLGDVQDIEFTIESGRLYFLQTRPAKRSPQALLRTTADLAREGLIGEAEALRRLEGLDLAACAVRRFAAEPVEPAACGLPASTGVAAGRVAFDLEAARRLAAAGPVILVRRDISTEDIAALALAAGVLTQVGGRTAHAAVVARQLGKVCVVGCAALAFDGPDRARLGEARLAEGDWLSLDGDTGRLHLGRLDIVETAPADALAEVARWRANIPAGAAAPV